MKEEIKKEIVLPAAVKAELNDGIVKLKGPKGEIERKFIHPKINISLEEGKIVLFVSKGTKREKMLIGSFAAHLKNMVRGVEEPFVYILKICSGHFPMNVSISGQEFIVKNFLGESVPRRAQIVKGAEVKINGTEIKVTSLDRELAGLMASRIENLCRITNRDLRIFQDGCYITHKAGKGVMG